ncbi:MAG TPA: acetolactate decarboxylase [Trichormus sp.]|jgi:acetolactate decarboxylase
MPKLEAEISEFLLDALEVHVDVGGKTKDQIVSQALALYFQSYSNTLYQVSTSSALVEGVYRGAVPISTLRQHGDLGLGTFEDLDGEMIIVDGQVYQALSDGTVHPVASDVKIPFAVITRFEPDHVSSLTNCDDFDRIRGEFDKIRQSNNLFYAFRVTGKFDSIHVRAVCKTQEGVPLVQAAAAQAEFTFENIEGTLVGFWSPEYAKSFNVPGYHFHFLSKDRTKGGHVLQCSGKALKLESHRESMIAVVLPETQEFLSADLSRDPSKDLNKAENSQNK